MPLCKLSGNILISSVQFSSVAQSCLTLCDLMNHSSPDLPVHHQLPEFTQTHEYRVGDAIQPSHPLLSGLQPLLLLQSLPASGYFPMSQLFTWGGQSIGVSALALVLSMTIQGWFPLIRTGLISLQFKGLSRVFSNTSVQNHQFLGAQFPYGPDLTSILTTGKNIALTRWNFIYIYKHICTHMVCCDSRGRKESDTTEQLNRTELKEKFLKRKIIMFWIKKANQLV